MTTRHDDAILIGREIDSPVGHLTLVASETALVGLYFEGHRPAPRERAERTGPSPVLDRAERALEAYFRTPAQRLDVPLAPRGSDLERAVWRELLGIAWGQTRSYGDIARALGRPRASRAVGSAVARNPLSILVPCHRVVGADGALRGFAGGLSRKAWLLAHEAGTAGDLCPSAGEAGRRNCVGSALADHSGRDQSAAGPIASATSPY